MDRLIGWIGAIGTVALLCLNAWEFGKDYGRKQAVAGYQCPLNTVYSVLNEKTGEFRCVLPRGRKG